MAVRETLELDLRKALSDVQTLERGIDELKKPVTIPIDLRGDAPQDIREIDQRLEDIEAGAREVASELGQMELAAGRAVVDFSKLATELNISEQEAEDLTREILGAQDAANRTSDAAREVARQLGLSEDDAKRFASEIGKGADRMDDLDDATRRTGRGLDTLRSGFSRLVAAAAVFVGIRELGQFASESITAFSGLQESTSKAEVVFGRFADRVFDFTENAPTELGSTRAAAIEAAASFGNLFLSVGLGQEAAAGLSTDIVQLGTDLASFNNISVDDALLRLRSGLVGETEPLRTMGVLLNEASVQAKGFELGLADANGVLSEAAKVQARYALIMEQTTTAQGDFIRTSSGLANSQRTATALFEEFKTRVGEGLAPAFQEILKLVPAIIDGFEDMIPSITSASLALAEFFTPKAGQADLLDFLNFITDLPRGFAEVGTAVNSIGNSLSTLGRTVLAVFNPLDDLSGPQAWAQGIERGAELAQDSLENINTQGLVQDLRNGQDAATALANRLAVVGQKGKLDPAFIRGLVTVAGTDLSRTRDALNALISDAERLNLAADDVTALRVALAQINSESESTEAERLAGRYQALADVAARDVVPTLDDMADSLADTQQSFVDLRTSTDPVISAWREMLTPAQDLELTLAALGEDVNIAADLFRQTLVPSVIDASQAVEDFNKDGKVSLDEFIASLRETETRTRAFRTNMLTILRQNVEAFAAIQAQPLEIAIELAAEAVTDPAKIEELAAAAVGDREALAEQINDIIRSAIQTARDDPALAEQELLASVTLFSDERIKQEIISRARAGIEASKTDVGNMIEDLFSRDDALNRAAGFTTDHYVEQLIERLGPATVAAGFDIFDLIEEAFTQEDAAASGAAQTVDEYRRAVINELAAQRFGFAGDIQDEMQRVLGASNLQIEVDVVPRLAPGTFTGTIGAGVVLNTTINNPTTTDLPTNVAQLEQSQSAVGGLINQVGPH